MHGAETFYEEGASKVFHLGSHRIKTVRNFSDDRDRAGEIPVTREMTKTWDQGSSRDDELRGVRD